MKSATVRDLRNSFARISRWIEAGESVEITKRGRLFAHILPASPPKKNTSPKPDILARLRADFGTVILPDERVEEILRNAGADYGERLS